MLALFVSPVFKPLYIIYRHNLYRLQCDVPKQLLELLNYLDYHTTREGRILIEDSEFDTKHQFFGGHFPGLFPEYVKREFLCGPRPMYTILHSYASFTSGVLFEKKLENYSLADLQRYFDGYNVKWIVCWRKESKEFFNKFPGYISKLSDIDRFTIYEVKRKTSFFIKGSGTIHSDYNCLELTDIVPKDREIIISYHWMQFLKTIPPLRLEKAQEMDDPVGFIRIIDPPKSLKIINGY
jgi:hypothetical protein